MTRYHKQSTQFEGKASVRLWAHGRHTYLVLTGKLWMSVVSYYEKIDSDISGAHCVAQHLRIERQGGIPPSSHNTRPKTHIPAPPDYIINRMLISFLDWKGGGCPAGFLNSLKGLVRYRRDIHESFTKFAEDAARFPQWLQNRNPIICDKNDINYLFIVLLKLIRVYINGCHWSKSSQWCW